MAAALPTSFSLPAVTPPAPTPSLPLRVSQYEQKMPLFSPSSTGLGPNLCLENSLGFLSWLLILVCTLLIINSEFSLHLEFAGLASLG